MWNAYYPCLTHSLPVPGFWVNTICHNRIWILPQLHRVFNSKTIQFFRTPLTFALVDTKLWCIVNNVPKIVTWQMVGSKIRKNQWQFKPNHHLTIALPARLPNNVLFVNKNVDINTISVTIFCTHICSRYFPRDCHVLAWYIMIKASLVGCYWPTIIRTHHTSSAPNS